MKSKRVLIERELSKDEVDKLTAAWWVINDTEDGGRVSEENIKKLQELKKLFNDYELPDGKMDQIEKRNAYDNIYDIATDTVFDSIKTAKSYKDIKDVMRKQWLKVGFEAGDGSDRAMNLTLDLIKRSNTAGNSDTLSRLVPYILNNYNYIDDYLDSNDDTSKYLRFFIVQRKDLWSKYTEKDITNIIGAIYKQLKNANPKEQTEIINKYLETDNLREFMKQDLDGQKTSNRVRTSVINNKSSDEDIEKVMKDVGLLGNKEIKSKVQKILNK